MSYFPVSFKINKVLIVGAGEIANSKLEKVLPFCKDITIISLDFSPKIEESIKKFSLCKIQKVYEKGDLKGFDIVIVATNNLSLQKEIYIESRDYKTLCNCVDIKECCDFLFNSYIKEGDLTITISTNGSSPAFAKEFKSFLKELLPKDIANFLEQMKDYRKTLPKGKDRMNLMRKKVKDYINNSFKKAG